MIKKCKKRKKNKKGEVKEETKRKKTPKKIYSNSMLHLVIDQIRYIIFTCPNILDLVQSDYCWIEKLVVWKKDKHSVVILVEIHQAVLPQYSLLVEVFIGKVLVVN